MFKKSIYMICFLSLAGCETTPQVEYRYTPPNTDTGLLCITICQNTRMQCKQAEDSHYRRCQAERALRDLKRENCLLRSDYEDNCYGYTHAVCWSSDYEECNKLYRECYQNCGGNVEAYMLQN